MGDINPNEYVNQKALEAMPEQLSKFIVKTGRGAIHDGAVWSIREGQPEHYTATMLMLGLRVDAMECFFTPPSETSSHGFMVAGMGWINVRDVHLHMKDMGYE